MAVRVRALVGRSRTRADTARSAGAASPRSVGRGPASPVPSPSFENAFPGSHQGDDGASAGSGPGRSWRARAGRPGACSPPSRPGPSPRRSPAPPAPDQGAQAGTGRLAAQPAVAVGRYCPAAALVAAPVKPSVAIMAPVRRASRARGRHPKRTGEYTCKPSSDPYSSCEASILYPRIWPQSAVL